jgi:hypothetical protein
MTYHAVVSMQKDRLRSYASTSSTSTDDGAMDIFPIKDEEEFVAVELKLAKDPIFKSNLVSNCTYNTCSIILW